MNEARYRLWDTVIKCITVFIALAGGLVGLMQYVSAARDQQHTSQIEFVNQRLAVLSQATTVAAALAAVSQADAAKTDDAVAKFWSFYNSQSVLLEGPDIQPSLNALVAALRALDDTKLDTYKDVSRKSSTFSDACQQRISRIQLAFGGDWLN